MAHSSIQRQQIAQAVVDEYNNTDLIYGERDCAHLAAMVLDAFGIRHPLKQTVKFKTVIQAARALKKAGFTDLAEAVDSTGLQRIGAASALPCDLIAVRAPDFIGGWSLGVVVGPNKFLGFIEHQGRIFAGTANLLEVIVFSGAAGSETVAWRVA
ncbi:DUF6950 family protein [Brevundimonas sp. TWP1-2-1b1]|uniref:DUF6950 family protein n=1 Tax=unclassified Brevundimonas TaxID=2622653 RepID=UPI003CF20515